MCLLAVFSFFLVINIFLSFLYQQYLLNDCHNNIKTVQLNAFLFCLVISRIIYFFLLPIFKCMITVLLSRLFHYLCLCYVFCVNLYEHGAPISSNVIIDGTIMPKLFSIV